MGKERTEREGKELRIRRAYPFSSLSLLFSLFSLSFLQCTNPNPRKTHTSTNNPPISQLSADPYSIAPLFQGVSSSRWPLLADSLCLLCLGHGRLRFTFLVFRGLLFRHPAHPSSSPFSFPALVFGPLYLVLCTAYSKPRFFSFFFCTLSFSFFSTLTFSSFVNP